MPHATLHPPQFCGSIEVSLQRLPHFVVPPKQPMPHVGPGREQKKPFGHVFPHDPQLFGSVFVSTHVVPPSPSEHVDQPDWQFATHLPAEQSWPGAHAFPHDPQWSSSL
jgi:hypothetical protein